MTQAPPISFAAALATVAAIPVTPFGPDGQVDWDAHARLIRRMVDTGVRLVTPNGNTGEFYALTAAETRRATESAVAAAGNGAGPPADVLAGVGHDLPSAIEAGRHARDNGVRMIMVHQPVGPYMSAAGWLEYHRAVAGALPDLGVVLYIRDPRIGARHIRLLGDLCPNVIAVKYGIRDPVLFAGVARDAGLDRFTWLAGLAELTAPACWTAGRARVHLGAGERGAGAVAVDAGVAARRGHRRRHEGVGGRAAPSRNCAPPTPRRTT